MADDEFTLIYRYFSSMGRGEAVDLSVGDDCAILSLQPGERMATSVDTLVAGTHFPIDAFPEDLAWRAVCVAASDLAAMGAEPRAMTLALTLPEVDEYWLAAFSQGLAGVCHLYQLPLVGGDTTRGPLTISIQVMGALPTGKALLRAGAKVGDQLLVSGTVGDGAAALAFFGNQWQPPPEQAEYLYQRFYRPTPRLDLGKSLLDKATAAIDVSDGLVADAGHIAAASGLALQIDPSLLPLSQALAAHPDQQVVRQWALTGGDDYELCFTLPAGAPSPKGCTVIGEAIVGMGVHCGLDIDSAGGYRHF